MRKGWFIIPGVQDGDRTLDEQIMGVRPALAEAKGKRVLDIGCAEGLIGIEFARAGAAAVHGIDSLEEHLAVARKLAAGLPVLFKQADLNTYAPDMMREHPENARAYDVVLALGVTHKLAQPGDAVRFAAWFCADLLLLRCKRGVKDGIIRSKHRPDNWCDAFEILGAEGFTLERTERGPRQRDEDVQYWRRSGGVNVARHVANGDCR